VGDHHEQAFDHLHKERKLYDLSKLSNQKVRYSGAPLDRKYCPFTLFSVVAAMIFVFTALVFYLYDVTVENRQKRVMQSAVRSSAIVSSLFPSSVRDQLYPVTQGTAQHDGFGKGAPLDDGETNLSRSAIAQAYPETTVLFADIAGFTAWSSSREPTQSFSSWRLFMLHLTNLPSSTASSRWKRLEIAMWQWLVCRPLESFTPWSWLVLPSIAETRWMT
jgi:hypothetical protein